MPLKVGHHRTIMATQRMLACSFVIFRGSGSILLGNPIFFDFSWGFKPLVPPSGSTHGSSVAYACLCLLAIR